MAIDLRDQEVRTPGEGQHLGAALVGLEGLADGPVAMDTVAGPLCIPFGVGMSQDDRLANLEERVVACERWAAAHDGRINEKWDQQDRWNERIDGYIGSLTKTVTELRITMAKYAGGAALIGALAGSLAPYFLKINGG